MVIFEGLVQLLESLYNQIINIPLDNALSYIYVILNTLLLLFATLY